MPRAKRNQPRSQPPTQFEGEAYAKGYRAVAGVDEAGRGPLAGPVVAAACLIPQGVLFEGIDDSKRLSPKKRAEFFEILTQDERIACGVGIVEAEEIDSLNIYQATLKAMRLAVGKLRVRPDYLLVDAMPLKCEGIPTLSLTHGDRRSHHIGAASIVAKVTRDHLMQAYHRQYPAYGFDAHKGYGTRAHLEALKREGPCPLHRKSFEPIKSLVMGGGI